MQPGNPKDCAHGCQVSILIRPLGRMQLAAAVHPGQHQRVSILIRPLGRMQRCPACRRGSRFPCFNPHPAPGPDATRARSDDSRDRLCTKNVFNSDFSCKFGFYSFSWILSIASGAGDRGSTGSSGDILPYPAGVSHPARLVGFGGVGLADWKFRRGFCVPGESAPSGAAGTAVAAR